MPDLDAHSPAEARPEAEPPTALPPFYDDLEGTLAETWRMLVHGVENRRAAFHTPVVTTLRRDGRPAARTVVLRAVDDERRTLRFHTDRRSMKYGEIAAEPRVALHFYDPGAKVQLCIDGRATLHADDALADRAWSESRPMSRLCYRVAPGPGTEIGDPKEAVTEDAGGNGQAGRENFAAISVAIDSIEWLYLAVQGHRRALFRWDGRGLSATWLVP